MNDKQTHNAEVVQAALPVTGLEILQTNNIADVTRGEIDIQISTAKNLPQRSGKHTTTT